MYLFVQQSVLPPPVGTTLFSAAYTPPFNPASLCANYLGDHGSSFPGFAFYQVTVPANGTIDVVVHEVNVGTGCSSYQLTVDMPRDLSLITASPSVLNCSGTSVLTAPVANSYVWSPGGATTSSITTSPLVATTKFYATMGYGNAGCTRQDSVTVTVNSTPITLNCPTNTTVAACQTQSAVNLQFAAWLATASGSGGSNGVLTNNNTGAPSACGGSTTVTFTYTNDCVPLTTTCQSTFTVSSAPPVNLSCPTNTTVAACQTQAAVNTQFATWLATATASGGCNGVLTNNNTGAPSACGGSTTVTFTYTSSCSPITTTCQSTFTVSAAPTVVLTCPTNTTVAACQTQSAVNTQFATWLANSSASGGCNGVLTNNNTGAPSACGGSTTVTFTYNSSCAPAITTCQATFTVAAPSTVTLTCPTNTTVAACQTQAAVNLQFATWLATASASGGCNGVLTNNNTGAPSACGGSTTVTFTYTSSCAPVTTTCQATFTVSAAPAVVLTCPTNTTVAACRTQAADQ
ncbi:MAG: hypothetical protein IPP93_06540 [Chitinophagaceae bacterium]|nr:hypothetical protein [Chitinophagaceae bacterium]